MADAWILHGGRIVDPATGRDAAGDLFVAGGLIVADPPRGPNVERVDASGLCVVPGFIDLHVHFREPGAEEAETVLTGSRAAARGGFTTVVTMPNTNPATDTAAMIHATIERARAAGCVRVRPAGALTVGRKGLAAADLRGMADAGAAAFTDDGSTPTDEGVLAAAMRQARAAGRPFMDHAQDPRLAGEGVMHAGDRAAAHGLPGIPPEAEIAAIERDIRLCAATGCAVHIQHISTAAGVRLVADARRRGLPVFAEASPHHLALTVDAIDGRDADYKMNPPLRSETDRQAIIAGVVDGTLATLATDHAPHAAARKARGFRDAPFGVVGLETAIGVTYDLLVVSGRMPLIEWVRRWTTGPAQVLGLPPPTLQPGQPADVAMLNLTDAWTVDPARFLSKSRNTPFRGRVLHGRAVLTLLAGRATWREP